jgi:hypothetical protein
MPINLAVSRRALRFALGFTLAFWCSLAFDWDAAFFTPLLTMIVLTTPMPAPSLKQGVGIVLVSMLPMLAGLMVLPFLLHAQWVGMLMIGLALFYSFYYTARGGSALLGTVITIALTLTVTIGSVSSEVLIRLFEALATNVAIAMLFVWIAHKLLPDIPLSKKQPKAEPVKPSVEDARRNAMRAFCIVFPLALLFLVLSASPAYTAIMIKVASMGHQSTLEDSRALGRSMLESTLWGGLGAIVAWNILSIWPSLTLYTLLMALAGLMFGRRIFQKSKSPAEAVMWRFAFVTMILVLAPAVTDSPASDGVAFWTRLSLFIVIAIYGTVAITIFDAFWPKKSVTALPESLA